MRTVAVAGATGSIGRQTLEVLRAEQSEFAITALSANQNSEELIAAAREFRPQFVVAGSDEAAKRLRDELDGIEVLVGDSGLEALSQSADVVMNGVVGFAGLRVTLSALHSGKRVALANKESLVAGSSLVKNALLTPKAELIPVDSEHSAIFQCLQSGDVSEVSELVLTSSGGPFRTFSIAQLQNISVQDALSHPKWDMGPKITIDSSTMMNKALEVIEANALFDVDYERIRVVIHPQAVVHSAVTFTDGSTVAQMSKPDMRLAISYALSFPHRSSISRGAIDWNELQRLDFEKPDPEKFPALLLGFDAGLAGGSAPAILNAANEVAVEAFLSGRVSWSDIARIAGEALSSVEVTKPADASELESVDQESRVFAEETIRRIS
jgi:1-deoxy-D-xylulose-5-phosphate reductoisomerase